MPLGSVRELMGQLPREGGIPTYCTTGQSSYYACRAIRNNGFKARNISGGQAGVRLNSKPFLIAFSSCSNIFR